jgi:hypothetical protein
MARTPELLDVHDKHLADRPIIELSLLEEVRRGNVRVRLINNEIKSIENYNNKSMNR